MNQKIKKNKRKQHVWTVFGILVGIIALAWVLKDFNIERFGKILEKADYRYLLPIPVLIAAEQVMRALKWKQFLFPLRPIGVWRLFGAVMAGYLANHIVPVRVSPLVRAWLVARLEDLRMGTVLATITLDRIVDGFVFTGFTVLALAFVTFSDETGRVYEGIAWGGAGSLALFIVLAATLSALRKKAAKGAVVLPVFLTKRLPRRAAEASDEFFALFAGGIVWPRQGWRRALIPIASIVMKLLAISHFFFTGLAFGVLLAPMQYVFIMVFLGFLLVLAGILRIVGSFTFGIVFVLQGFGVDTETGLAMALTVMTLTSLTIVGTGAGALWLEGIGLDDLRKRPAPAEDAAVSSTNDRDRPL